MLLSEIQNKIGIPNTILNARMYMYHVYSMHLPVKHHIVRLYVTMNQPLLLNMDDRIDNSYYNTVNMFRRKSFLCLLIYSNELRQVTA